MEAELTTLDTAGIEAEWLRELLIVEKPMLSISMNCDNQAVIIKVNSSKDNMKSIRHVKRCLKSVIKLRNSGVITLDYFHTSNNLADQFTKRLSCNVIYRRKLVDSLPWGIPTAVVYRHIGVQATNSMVMQDTDKDFIQVRPPCGCNTYVLCLIILI